MKITRTIKVSYFKARVWNDVTEQMESRNCEFFDAMSDKDIERAYRAELAKENENLSLVKMSKQGETVYKTSMALEKYFELADKEVAEVNDKEVAEVNDK